MDVTEEKEIFVTIICRSDKQTKTEINNVRDNKTKQLQKKCKIELETKIIDLKTITNERNQNEKKSGRNKCKLKNDVVKS